MTDPQMVMYEEEFRQIHAIVETLVQAANASVAFIIDKNGQLIAAGGDAAIFDKKTSLGLVRLRVKKACEQLVGIFQELAAKSSGPGHAMFAEITDDDIDNLFND